MRPYGPRKEPQHDLAVNTLTYNMDDGMYCRIAARRRNLYWLTHESGLPDDATVLHMPSITWLTVTPALAERVHGETHLMVAPAVTPNPYEGIMRGSRYGDRYLTAKINGLSVISVARYAADHPSDRYDTGKEPDLAITYDRKDRLLTYGLDLVYPVSRELRFLMWIRHDYYKEH